MSEVEIKVAQFLLKRGPSTCTEVGEAAIAKTSRQLRQSYARPAGAVLHRMRKRQLVRLNHEYTNLGRGKKFARWVWSLTATGEKQLQDFTQ